MLIKKDMSYINESDKFLVENGLEELDIHSLNFDRYYMEEEKENNMRLSHELTTEQWNNRCEEISKNLHLKMLPIVELLNTKYDIYQFAEDVYYKSDWDLYFYSNKGWNNRNYFDYMKISFNGKRSVQANLKLHEEILEILGSLEVKNVSCRVQYTVRKNELEIKSKAIAICKNILNKTISYNGMEGKIKTVHGYEGLEGYGFFKKRARGKYYTINPIALLQVQM